MFKNLPLFIGLRYTRSKRREGFVSFISGFSLFAMALGVMALILVLSVMNGFDREIKAVYYRWYLILQGRLSVECLQRRLPTYVASYSAVIRL